MCVRVYVHGWEGMCMCKYHNRGSLQDVRVREAGLRGELEAQATEMTRLREQLRECQERIPGGATKVRGHKSDGVDDQRRWHVGKLIPAVHETSARMSARG